MNKKSDVRIPEKDSESPPLPSTVDHPHWYNSGAIECIDALEAQLGPEGFRAFLRGQVAKYIWRAPHKASELEDCQKALWYLARLVKTLSKEAG